MNKNLFWNYNCCYIVNKKKIFNTLNNHIVFYVLILLSLLNLHYQILCNETDFKPEITIQTSIPKHIFTIGDKISINYNLLYNHKLILITPHISDKLEQLEVCSYSTDSSKQKFNLTLIAFESGKFKIPAITFSFEDTISHKIYTKLSDEIAVQVEDIKLNQDSAIKEIPAQKLDEWQFNYIYIFISIFIIAIFLILIKFKRYLSKK